jgi:hypothetical protein
MIEEPMDVVLDARALNLRSDLNSIRFKFGNEARCSNLELER